jgi:hypothetical protein
MFAWCNNLRKIHGMILFMCVCAVFWLPVMKGNPSDIELTLTESNNYSAMDYLRQSAFISEYHRLFDQNKIHAKTSKRRINFYSKSPFI